MVIEPVIFLDIDGVLNNHNFNNIAKSNSINQACVARLNKIIKITKASIVLSSAWRYMIIHGAITTKGFEYLLRTHGVTEHIKIIGVTPLDEEIPDRVNQIKQWIKINGPITKYLIIDDMDLAVDNFIKIDGQLGLTTELTNKIIEVLS